MTFGRITVLLPARLIRKVWSWADVWLESLVRSRIVIECLNWRGITFGMDCAAGGGKGGQICKPTGVNRQTN